MKRLKRDPVRFDVFAAFGHFAAQHGLSIRDSTAVTQFSDVVRVATEDSLNNDIFVYGTRVQNMFETIVAALGRVRLLKQEDAGDVYADVDIKVPDYRLVVEGGRQILVEVKNFRQREGTEVLEQKVDYIAKLKAYGAITGCEVLFAVYWYRWNLWTLVSTDVFVKHGDIATLQMGDALKANQMACIGDFMVGTRWPLRFRIEMDEIARDGNCRTMMIRSVNALSEDRLISDPIEIRIAIMLMFYGDWSEEQVVEERNGKLVSVEYQFAPDEDSRKQHEQGFDMNAWISSMIARFFRDGTTKDGEVRGFRVDFTPGEFGRLIPEDYDKTRNALPLWRFHLQASDAANPAEGVIDAV